MAFISEFIHVPKITGEYWVPLDNAVQSDRISDLQRVDKQRFFKNRLLIKAQRPPKPWRDVLEISVVLPVEKWDEASAAFIVETFDTLSYPVEMVLVNLAGKKGVKEARRVLGDFLDLPPVSLHTAPVGVRDLEAYRFGVERAETELVYLASRNVDSTFNKNRLFLAADHLKKKACEAISWITESQPPGTIDLLTWRNLFLQRSGPGQAALNMQVDLLPLGVPQSFKADNLLTTANEHLRDNRLVEAYETIQEAMTKDKGPTRQFFMGRLMEIMMSLGKYSEAENEFRNLIREGYRADNWIKLGRALQMQGRFAEALDAYQNGLSDIGLTDRDLSSAAFPIDRSVDCAVFTGFLCSGECFFSLKNHPAAEAMFARAARVIGPNHWPHLWLGRLYMTQGRLDDAERALMEAVRRNDKSPEAFGRLGQVCLDKRRKKEAFTCFSQAIRLGAVNPRSLEAWFRLGEGLNAWHEMETLLRDLLKLAPDNRALLDLSGEVRRRLGGG